jgi:pimeloyl-ACP methyl ester carboxylesterase
VESWKVETEDGGRLEGHSFLTPAELEQPTAGPPGVVLLHGTLVTDALYRPFARKLSLLLGRPVHCYNRRGRAGSSPQPEDYSVKTEVSDLAIVMRETGSTDVVAHSYGGFVA